MAAKLPVTPFKLHGGCFCSAIRYTISVPELSERKPLPQSPKNLERLLVPINEVNERMPIVSFDHCQSCRRVPGALVECWFICPPSWVEFTLQPRESSSSSPDEQKDVINLETMEYLDANTSLAERTYVTHFKSSEHSNRTFCAKCGTHLTFLRTGPITPLREMMGLFFNIAVGTLDSESVEKEGLAPAMQAWPNDGISWVVKLLMDGKKSLLADEPDDVSKLTVDDSEKK